MDGRHTCPFIFHTPKIGFEAKWDINVIDYDNLSIAAPEMAYDLPTGAPRLLQESSGYKATLVAGEIVRQDDEFTGARPGRLIRGRR